MRLMILSMPVVALTAVMAQSLVNLHTRALPTSENIAPEARKLHQEYLLRRDDIERERASKR
jgi:hypothetical protein